MTKKGGGIMMKNIFWESFCETGRIDMYMLYKEFGQEQNLKNPTEKEYPKESLDNTLWEVPLT